MNVDPGFAVCVFRDDARDIRHIEFQQRMGDPVGRDGVEAGISPDDFVPGTRCRVTLEHRAGVVHKDSVNLRKRLEEFTRNALRIKSAPDPE